MMKNWTMWNNLSRTLQGRNIHKIWNTGILQIPKNTTYFENSDEEVEAPTETRPLGVLVQEMREAEKKRSFYKPFYFTFFYCLGMKQRRGKLRIRHPQSPVGLPPCLWSISIWGTSCTRTMIWRKWQVQSCFIIQHLTFQFTTNPMWLLFDYL